VAARITSVGRRLVYEVGRGRGMTGGAAVTTWQRVLIGGAVGLAGVLVYLLARLRMETAKRLSWGEVVGLAVLGIIGMVFAGVGDRVLEPVTVPLRVRWVLIALLAVAGAACLAGLARARAAVASDRALMTSYYGAFLVHVARDHAGRRGTRLNALTKIGSTVPVVACGCQKRCTPHATW
jgi:hypothetical protein